MDIAVSKFGENIDLSPYRVFSRSRWAGLRADTPLTLTIADLEKLQSLNDPVSLNDVIEIYLPLSRLLSLYVAATQGLFKATQRFLLAEDGKVPYIIAVAGSVAAGKSTTGSRSTRRKTMPVSGAAGRRTMLTLTPECKPTPEARISDFRVRCRSMCLKERGNRPAF